MENWPPVCNILMYLPKEKREEARKRASCHGIKSCSFHPRMEELMKAADVVISMGGYNTICEILTHGTPAFTLSGLGTIRRRTDLFKKQHAILSMRTGVDALMPLATGISPELQGMMV